MALVKERPVVVRGSTYRVRTGHGNLFVTVNWRQGEIFEVFLVIGKQGTCFAALTEAIGRLISMGLRAGIEIEEVIKQLQGIQCAEPLWSEGVWVSSIPDAVAKVLKLAVGEPIPNEDIEGNPEDDEPEAGPVAPVGGGPQSPSPVSSQELEPVGVGGNR